jgi:hypothetical protein
MYVHIYTIKLTIAVCIYLYRYTYVHIVSDLSNGTAAPGFFSVSCMEAGCVGRCHQSHGGGVHEENGRFTELPNSVVAVKGQCITMLMMMMMGHAFEFPESTSCSYQLRFWGFRWI